ncbi:hypothetical protein ACFB49_15610 [Sphingomonas sp. DBB INV C78]
MLASVGLWFISAPIWTIGLVVFGGMALGMFIGRQLRKRFPLKADKAGDGEKVESQESFMVTSVMGLLALLLGFTFSLAVDRFETRRGNVLTEANAIGTTYLRSQLLEEPHRERLSKLLIDYTDTRIALATEQSREARAPLLQHNDQLIADLWTATVAAFPSMRPYDFSSSYLETMNNMIDMDTTRKAGRLAHVPAEIFFVLLLYQFIASIVISYFLIGPRGQKIALFLFLLFSVVLLLVIDIERPTSGGIQESQAPMLMLRDFMKQQPPASFDRFNLPPAVPTPSR